MIRDLYDNIVKKEELRQNLIKLKAELKKKENKTALLYYIGKDYRIFEQLLHEQDAKVRKNAALIIGELELPDFLDKLYVAYKEEKQLFVKSAYLTAIKEYDYRSILVKLKNQLEELIQLTPEEADKKHINEEVRVLSDLILRMEGIKKHPFTGYRIPSKLVLLTNRNYKQITQDQLKDKGSKAFNAGIIVETADLKDVLNIRTVMEVLFMLDDIKICSQDIKEAARQLSSSSLLDFMKKRHIGEAPFYFRIEMKSKQPLDKKSSFTKKLAVELEKLSNRELLNSTSRYEFEIRLIENKDGDYNVLLKLYTIADERFSYRKNVLPTSIHPVNAALCISLATPYLKVGGQVLDPFCGVGTMLIERHKMVAAYSMYGLDLYEEAINKARENSEAAEVITHYINRDFFDFKHEYLFDEIITDMPFTKNKDGDSRLEELYRRFFEKVPTHLKPKAILVIYSHNKNYIKKAMNPSIYKIIKEYEISKVEGAYLYIIQYQ